MATSIEVLQPWLGNCIHTLDKPGRFCLNSEVHNLRTCALRKCQEAPDEEDAFHSLWDVASSPRLLSTSPLLV